MQYKLKHRLSAALMAGAMCCTMIPAASADEIATPETADRPYPCTVLPQPLQTNILPHSAQRIERWSFCSPPQQTQRATEPIVILP